MLFRSLLHQPINVDSRDSQGHTSLMWAAYQGDALSVDILLKHGANVNVKDDAGLTPLHWAVVRGNRICIRRLLEHGSEISAKDGEGRTARDMAVELKSLGAWKRALEEGDFTEDGFKRNGPLSDVSSKSWGWAVLTLKSEKYQNPNFPPTDIVPVLNVYDPHHFTMVYGRYFGHGPVLWHAPRTFRFLPG